MRLNNTPRFLILSGAGLMVLAVSFFALAPETNTIQDDSFLASVFAYYEIILAGVENGNLTPEADNFLLTLHKWIAFLTDLYSAK
jgi:hypothetical protein